MSSVSRRKTTQRRAEMLAAGYAGELSTAELAQRFGVTESTIRRDLRELSANGAITRTYGGMSTVRSGVELNVPSKARRRNLEKTAIARAAAAHVEAAQTVILDAGTTVGAMATQLLGMEELTVVTGSLSALLALHDAPEIDVIVIGGRLRQINQGTVGAMAERNLKFVSADAVFLGAEGIDPVRGLCCPTVEQAMLKLAMMERSRNVYVLADSSKLGHEPFTFWAPLPPHVTLITDRVDEDFAGLFRAESNRDIEIVEVPNGGMTNDIADDEDAADELREQAAVGR